MANTRQHSFYDMEPGDVRECAGECPVSGKKQKMHLAFYKYAQRKGWRIKTSVDRTNDTLILERLS